MIEIHDVRSAFVVASVEGVMALGIASTVQLTVSRHESGVYSAQLGRLTTAPAQLAGMDLGELPDVPPGQRRATWLLTDAVNMALHDPEAHRLLHW